MKKIMNKVLHVMVLSALLSLFFVMTVGAKEQAGENSLISDMVSAINSKDVDAYIGLFTSENQKEMNEFILQNSAESFFRESGLTVVECIELPDEIGKNAVDILAEEVSAYDEIRYLYFQLEMEEKAVADDSGFRVAVLVKENGTWRILRVSVPDISTIIEANEGFHSDAEMESAAEQERAMQGMTRLGPITMPSKITVYFTKTNNISSWGGRQSYNVPFADYVKDVGANEWTSSWYSQYPAYLRAGMMASKMYGWYATIHPKWNYAPYYADVKDDTSDQQYVHNSNNSYTRSAWNDIANVAMVSNVGNVFEVHYRANSGAQYSGTMNAAGALEKARSGQSYTQILHYYYDNSPYSGGSVIFLNH